MLNNYLFINKIKEYFIFDVFHTCGKLKILAKYSKKKIREIKFLGKKPINIHHCMQDYTIIYDFNMPLYEEEVTLTINGNDVKTSVNKYIDTKDEIIMSTVTKDQDKYIISWIEYYKHLGISRFIIYDNSTRRKLGRILNKYIKEQVVLLFDFSEVKYRKKGKLLAQPLQQNHSLHAFKNSKYIGMLDIDEYLNPQRKYKLIPEMLEKLLQKSQCNYRNLAGFSFQNRFFYNPEKKKDTNYKHFYIPYCDKTTTKWFRKKMFINPANVSNFSVHVVTTYIGKDLLISPKQCFFNHYRYLGFPRRNGTVYQNKDKSILRHIKWLDSVD